MTHSIIHQAYTKENPDRNIHNVGYLVLIIVDFYKFISLLSLPG